MVKNLRSRVINEANHIINTNETIRQVAQKYQVSMEELRRVNKDSFNEGDLITIPLRHE